MQPPGLRFGGLIGGRERERIPYLSLGSNLAIPWQARARGCLETEARGKERRWRWRGGGVT